MSRRGAVLAVLAVCVVAGCSASDGGSDVGSYSVSVGPPSVTSPASMSSPPSSLSSSDQPGTSVPEALSCAWTPCYSQPSASAELHVTPEASGVAASSVDPDVFFVVDDGTGVSAIAAVRLDGSTVGQVEVDGMSARNAEALVAGVCENGSAARCLYVGDIGGNSGRGTVDVYRMAEPDPADLPGSAAADAWSYTYPDGKYNAEALLISHDGSIVVITKPDGGVAPHRVYVGAPGGGSLVLSSTFTPPAPLQPVQSTMVGNVVTDAARLEDRVILLTYDQAVEYRAPTPDADPATFPTWPFRQLEIPSQWQSEGVTYREPPGCGYVVVSEKSPFGGPAIGSVGCV